LSLLLRVKWKSFHKWFLLFLLGKERERDFSLSPREKRKKRDKIPKNQDLFAWSCWVELFSNSASCKRQLESRQNNNNNDSQRASAKTSENLFVFMQIQAQILHCLNWVHVFHALLQESLECKWLWSYRRLQSQFWSDGTNWCGLYQVMVKSGWWKLWKHFVCFSVVSWDIFWAVNLALQGSFGRWLQCFESNLIRLFIVLWWNLFWQMFWKLFMIQNYKKENWNLTSFQKSSLSFCPSF
jgi:hypothetical protein